MKEFFEKADVELFKERVEPIQYLRRGMFLSEAFAICALCDALNVDLLIESGTAHGRSTEIFAKYGIQVDTIDRIYSKYMTEEEAEGLWEKTKARLAEHGNIRFIKGDGASKIRKIINGNPNKRIALFIDGPKWKEACLIGQKHMKDVAFVAIHDQHPDYMMSRYFKKVMYTDSKWYRERFGMLDDNDFNALRSMGKDIPDDFAGQGLGIAINQEMV